MLPLMVLSVRRLRAGDRPSPALPLTPKPSWKYRQAERSVRVGSSLLEPPTALTTESVQRVPAAYSSGWNVPPSFKIRRLSMLACARYDEADQLDSISNRPRLTRVT